MVGRVVTVEGHFDDPAAADCVGEALQPGTVVDPAVVVYNCRLALVLTSVRPQGVPAGGAPDGPFQAAEPCAPGNPAGGPAPISAAVAVDDWAEVIVDEVNLRQCPSVDALSYGRLPRGSAGLVVAGPVEADGYAWYALAAPGIPFGSGCEFVMEDPTLIQCPDWFGWVASADAAGDPWLAQAELQCPPIPQSVEEMAAIPAGVRLACHAGETITFDALIAPPGVQLCEPGYAVTPEWLDPCATQVLSTEPYGILAHLHPDAGTCDPRTHEPAETCPYAGLEGSVVTVEGHFDDPAATSCVGEDLGLYDIGILDQAAIVYECRLAFVLTAVRPQD